MTKTEVFKKVQKAFKDGKLEPKNSGDEDDCEFSITKVRKTNAGKAIIVIDMDCLEPCEELMEEIKSLIVKESKLTKKEREDIFLVLEKPKYIKELEETVYDLCMESDASMPEVVHLLERMMNGFACSIQDDYDALHRPMWARKLEPEQASNNKEWLAYIM